MDKTYIHLIITDLPIFASMLGAGVLAYGLWKKSEHTIIAAYFLLIIASVGAGISYYTGGFAAETLKSLIGDFSEGASNTILEKHRQFALYTLITLIALGLFSFVGLWLSYKKSSFAKNASIIILLLSVVSFGLGAKTGSLGGEIRHTEIRSNSNSGEGNEQEKGMQNSGGKGGMSGE